MGGRREKDEEGIKSGGMSWKLERAPWEDGERREIGRGTSTRFVAPTQQCFLDYPTHHVC